MYALRKYFLNYAEKATGKTSSWSPSRNSDARRGEFGQWHRPRGSRGDVCRRGAVKGYGQATPAACSVAAPANPCRGSPAAHDQRRHLRHHVAAGFAEGAGTVIPSPRATCAARLITVRPRRGHRKHLGATQSQLNNIIPVTPTPAKDCSTAESRPWMARPSGANSESSDATESKDKTCRSQQGGK